MIIGTPKQLIAKILYLDETKKYELKPYKKKRSNNANSYLWVLVNEIGNVLRKSKEEVYLQMLKDYGQSTIVSVLSNIDINGYFKYYEKLAKATIKDKEFTHYKIFKGSSEYNTEQMNILLTGVVEEAKQLNIETLTPEELQRLKEWGSGK